MTILSSIKNAKKFWLFSVACLGHFIIDFSIGLWPVWKTIARYNLAQAGMIAGISVMIGEAMQGIFSIYADRGFYRPLIVAGCLIASASLALPLTSSLEQAGFLFFLTCLGSSAFHPTAVGIVSKMHGYSKTVLISVFHTSGLLGLAVSQYIFSALLQRNRYFPLLCGIVPIILALVVWIMKKRAVQEEKKMVASSATASQKKISLYIFLEFLQRKELRRVYLLLLCNQIMTWSILFLLPDVLIEKHCSDQLVYGGGHFIYVIGAACACIPLGILAKRLNTSFIILVTYIVSIFSLYATIGLSIHSQIATSCMLFLLGGSIGAIAPLALAIGNDLEPHHSATVSAFLMGFVWIFSEGIGYSLSAYIATYFEKTPAISSLTIMSVVLLFGVAQAYALYHNISKGHSVQTDSDMPTSSFL